VTSLHFVASTKAPDFHESACEAGARQARWDIDRYACLGVITNPILKAGRMEARQYIPRERIGARP
jgi:hypothetical protein